MTHKHENRVLFLAGKFLASGDYLAIDAALPAQKYFAETTGEALEQLMLRRYSVMVVTDRFAGIDLSLLCKTIRFHQSDVQILVVGNPSEETRKQLVRTVKRIRFIRTESSVENLCAVIEQMFEPPLVLAATAGGHSDTKLLDWILGKKPDTEIEIQLRTARQVLQQLLHSASQGKGVGTLIGYIDLLQAGAKTEDGNYVIGADFFQSIMENAAASREWIENLESALKALSSDIELAILPGQELRAIVTGVLAENHERARIKQQVLAVDFRGFDGSIRGNAAVLTGIFDELVVNAFKYSPVGGFVRVTAGFVGHEFEIQVINTIEEQPEVQFPVKSLTEPFFRAGNQIDERYASFRYGVGIGLTICQYQARQMKGYIEIQEKPPADPQSGLRRIATRLVFPALI